MELYMRSRAGRYAARRTRGTVPNMARGNERKTVMYDEKIRALRMERQHLLTPANETEYDALYRKPLKNATMTQAFYHGKRRLSPPCKP